MAVAALTQSNAARWKSAKIKPDKFAAFASVAKRLVAFKARYQEIEALTGVPWFIVAVIHEREASQRWDRSIAQGDPWNAESIHVPKGRGPFKSFRGAALDALKNCAPFAARWKDWSAGGTLTLLEHYNGLGYAKRGKPSPYIWSGTDQYKSGKYVADGVYDAKVVDSQLGCAGLLLAMDVTFETTAVEPFVSGPVAPELEDAIGGGDAKASASSVADPELLALQVSLKSMNYNPGSPEGNWGGMTAGALSGFLTDRGGSVAAPTSLEQFDAAREQIQAEVAKAESESFMRPVSIERAAGEKHVVEQVAPEVVPAHRNFLVAAWGSFVAFLSAIWTAIGEHITRAWDWITDHKDDLPTDPSYLHTAWTYVQMVPTAVWIASAACGLAFIAFNSFNGVKKITESVQSGARQ